MLILTILYLLLSFNLFDVIAEKTTTFYKDVRFWLVLISLVVLMWLTLQSYPIN